MKRQREIIILLVTIFIVVIVWASVNIYHNARASTINDTLTQEIIDISPNFNTAILEKLKNRINLDPIYTFPTRTDFSESIIASSSVKDTKSPIVLQSTPTSSQSSTYSGTLSQ